MMSSSRPLTRAPTTRFDRVLPWLRRHGIFLTLLVGFLIRAWVVIGGWQTPPIQDELAYYNQAQTILKELLSYTGVFRPPLYPAFLALALRIFGEGRFGIDMLQAALDTVTIALLYALTHRLFKRVSLALLAGLLYAINPMMIFMASSWLSEIIFNLFSVAAFWLLLSGKATWRLRHAVLAGVCLGLAALTREIMVYVALGCVPLALVVTAQGQWRAAIKFGVAMYIGLAVILGPWIVRNALLYDRLILVSTSGEFNLVKDNFKVEEKLGRQQLRGKAKRIAPPKSSIENQAMQVLNDAPPSQRSSLAIRLAWKSIRHYPELWLKYKLLQFKAVIPLNLAKLPYLRGYHFNRTAILLWNWAFRGSLLVVVGAGLLGLFFAAGDFGKLLLVLYLLVSLAIFVLTHYQYRYGLPLLALLMPYSAFGLGWLLTVPRQLRQLRFWTSPRLYLATVLVVWLGAFLFPIQSGK